MPTALAVLAVLAAMVGCSPVYDAGPPRPGEAAVVTPRTQWKLSGTLTDLPLANDGSDATGARADLEGGRPVVVIDLGKACLLNMVTVTHAVDDGYAQRLSVHTSMDGRQFVKRHESSGKRRVTVMTWIEPVLARYVRIQVDQRGPQPWSVAEVYIQ